MEPRVLLASIYVDADAAGATHNGTSWGTAYQDLQAALGAAKSGDQLMVAAGTYRPTATTDRAISFQLKDGVSVLGGYAGYGAPNPDARDIVVYATILSGDIGAANNKADNSYHVVTGSSGITTATVVDGVTITAGNANGTWPSSSGAGIYLSAASPTLTNCIVSANSAYSGGGMYNDGSSPTLTNCAFSANSASYYGGMYNESSSPTLTNCTFTGNSTTSYGGGMYNKGGFPTVINCAFTANSASYDGGGIYNCSSAKVINCTFAGNSASRDGGGVYNYSSSPVVTDCTFSGNKATSHGGGMYNDSSSPALTNCVFAGNSAGTGGQMCNASSPAKLTNCIVWGSGSSPIYNISSTPVITYSDIQGGYTGTGNLNVDPQFIRNPSAGLDGVWGTVDDDYGDLRLRHGSPAIDAGNNAASGLAGITTDLAGQARFVNVPGVADTGSGTAPLVDMGAYEFNPPVDIVLTSASIAENQPVGTTVGGFSSTEPDPGDTFTYSLVSGTGSADNASFQIVSGQLQSAASFNYEAKSSYAIRVRTTDQGGLYYEKAFTITVTNVNETPTGIALSSANVGEGLPPGTAVGTFTTSDPDSGDTFSYTLVAGVGADDNASFTIAGSTLKTAAVFNAAAKGSYSIRVRATDAGGLSVERTLGITVTTGGTVALAWSSYLGDGGGAGLGVAVDASGNAWVVGRSGSSPWAVGGFDVTYNGGTADAFVAKVSAAGTLLWSTYLGGSDFEEAASIAIDGNGNAWVVGQTHSTDLASGGFDTTYNGGDHDAFVAKINADGSLAWSTYLGGSGNDVGLGIAVDSSGNGWVTGYTYSADLPGGGFDPTYNGYEDGFVTKINADGSLAWSSYLGGDGYDSGEDIAIDGGGNAWITGETSSVTWASGGYDTSFNGWYDAYVAKINADGTFAWSTFMGGSNGDHGNGIALDSNGNAWVTGYTYSSGWAVGGFDVTYNGGTFDAFVAKINADGALAWSSYLGGGSDEKGQEVAIDAVGNAWLTGQTYSGGWVSGGFDTSFGGGYTDAYVALVNADGSLAWTSYLGGNDTDSGIGVAVGVGGAWVTGQTLSTNWVSGGFDTVFSGSYDAYVARISVNHAPTSLNLSNSTIAENQPTGTTVGTFSTTDSDAGDSFTYSLVSGTGSTDNNSFQIVGSELHTAASFDYEAKNSCSIRVRTTDPAGFVFEQVFTITVTNANEAPTGAVLSSTSVHEGLPPGTTVGTFTTSDPDLNDTFTYSLVSGAGADDNAQFSIFGNILKTAAPFDYEAGGSYSIRVRATDVGGLWIEKTFIITVTDVNETPTDIGLSGNSLAENRPAGMTVAMLGSTDPDAGNTFTYSLVGGTGSSDNALFTLNGVGGYALVATVPFDYETRSSYSIRIRSTDQGGLWTEKVFTIAVTNVNEAPTDIGMSGDSVAENQGAWTMVGVFSTTDPDSGDTFSYSLVSGAGSTDNGLFNIVGGDALFATASFDYEAKNSYSIRIRSTDQGGLWTEKVFTVSVTNVNEVPSVSGVSKSLIQDTMLPFGRADFSAAFSDPDLGDNLQAIQIISLPTHGLLRLGGVAVVQDQVIAASALGTLTYTPVAAYVGADSFGWSGSDGSLYSPAGATVSLTVKARSATTTAVESSATNCTYGQSVTFTATVSSADGMPAGSVQFLIDGTLAGAPITLAPDGSAACTMSGLHGGSHTITVNYTGDTSFNASTGSLIQTIDKADQAITWATPAAIIYGTPLGDAEFNATVAGVAGGSLPGDLVYGLSAGTVLDAGSHTLMVLAEATADYNEASFEVTLVVNKAALTVTADPKRTTYGQAIPTLTGTLSGVVGDDDITVGYSVHAAPLSSAGEYAIKPVWSDPDGRLDNYTVTSSGTLTIDKADQTITWATPGPILVGTALGDGQLNATVAGVVGGSAPGALTYGPVAGTVLGVGSHTLTVTAAATADYNEASLSVSQMVQTPLVISGTTGNDRIVIKMNGNLVVAAVNGVKTRTAVDEVASIRIVAGAGDDTVIVNSGVMGVVIVGGGGNDSLTAGDGNDTIKGGIGDDLIHGGLGDDRLIGGAGDDMLYGDGGNDALNGGPGRDVMYGGSGADTFTAKDGEGDMIFGGAGADTATVDDLLDVRSSILTVVV